MPIISISLDEFLLRDIDTHQEDMGFSGRSDMIRASLREYISEHKEKEHLEGEVEGVLIAIHDDKHSKEISNIGHKYEPLIKTQIHNQLKNHKCLEMFILKGDGKKIIQLRNQLKTNKKIDFVKLVVN